MNPCELTASVTAIANMLSCNLSIYEISLLGSAFAQLGDTLMTIAAQKSLCENTSKTL